MNAQRHKITIDRYQQMVSAGVFGSDNRIELIDGEMLEMAPIGPAHCALTTRLTRLFVQALGARAVVVAGGPVNLGHFCEPQPDVMLLKPRADDYAQSLPKASDVLLIIEVSDRSLPFDQGAKCKMYARFGIPEYWIVDVRGKHIQVHLTPNPQGYSPNRVVFDVLSPTAFPALTVNVRDLFKLT